MNSRSTFVVLAVFSALSTVANAATLPPVFTPLFARADALYSQAAQLSADPSKTNADVDAHATQADAYANAIDAFESAVGEITTDVDLDSPVMIARRRLAQFGRYAARSVDAAQARCSPIAARGNLRVARALLDDAHAQVTGKGSKTSDWIPPVLKTFMQDTMNGGVDEHCPYT